MADLFGLDIASLVNSAIAGAGGVLPGTLTRIIPGVRGDNPTDGTNPTKTTHSFSGFVEQKDKRILGEVAAANQSTISILGASINPVAVPRVNDQVLLDGSTYTLVELLSLDPARALYEFSADS
jgi:hypothetical protein